MNCEPLSPDAEELTQGHEFSFAMVAALSAYPAVEVLLQPGQAIKAESDAMVAASGNIAVDAGLDGGFFASLTRSIFGGESLFFQSLTPLPSTPPRPARVILSSSYPGDVMHLQLGSNDGYLLRKDAFLAGSMGLNVSVHLQMNLKKTLFSSLGFTLLKAQGPGDLFVSSDAAIVAIEVPQGETIVVDNGHVVAFPAQTRYEVEMAPSLSQSWIRPLASGEAVVLRFWGPSTVFIATRKPIFGLPRTSQVGRP